MITRIDTVAQTERGRNETAERLSELASQVLHEAGRSVLGDLKGWNGMNARLLHIVWWDLQTVSFLRPSIEQKSGRTTVCHRTIRVGQLAKLQLRQCRSPIR